MWDLIRNNWIWIVVALVILWLLLNLTKKQGDDDEGTPAGGAPA